MHRSGHVGLGLAAYAPLALVLSAVGRLELLALGTLVAVFLSYAPDYDLRIPFVSHRGITHTVLVALLAGLVAGAGFGWLWFHRGGGSPSEAILAAGVGLLTGVLGVGSHLLGDALTPMGIRPYAPFSAREISLGAVRSANRLANWGLLVSGGAVFLAALAAGTWLRTGGVPG